MPRREPASEPRRRSSDSGRGESGERSRDQGRSPARRSGGGRPDSPPRKQGGQQAATPRSSRGKSWGGVARRGAAWADRTSGDREQGSPGSASEAWRRADEEAGANAAAPAWEAEIWEDEGRVDEDDVRDAARRAADRGGRGREGRERSGASRQSGSGSGKRTPRGPKGEQRGPKGAVGGDEVSLADEVKAAVGPQKAERIRQRLDLASTAFRRGRYEEARKTLRPLAEQAPRSPAIRELYGLTLYRLGRWKQAARELEAWRSMTGDVEQHPVLADCYRALGRYVEVEELWDELRTTGGDPGAMAEGRIVAAGALADQGRLKDGIALLERAVKPARKAKPHHVRLAYALADLYERAGELPRAREMFQRVAASDPDFVDVRARLRALD